jgi:hypothetical protein
MSASGSLDAAATRQVLAKVVRRGRRATQDDATLGALKDLRRRVRQMQREGAASAPALPTPLSPLNSNPARFIEGEKIESDYQSMCRSGSGAAITAAYPATHRRFTTDGPKRPTFADSDTFRELMAMPSLTQRERRLANRVPGKQYAPNGRAVYPWDANGGLTRPDNIALLDGYRYERGGNPVEGCSAQWSARREAAANKGVTLAVLSQTAEFAGMGYSDRGVQITTPQVPRTNAARRNYPISARNNNFGSNKSTDIEYGQMKQADDPTRGVMPPHPAHRTSTMWKPDAISGGGASICTTSWTAQMVPPWD